MRWETLLITVLLSFPPFWDPQRFRGLVRHSRNLCPSTELSPTLSVSLETSKKAASFLSPSSAAVAFISFLPLCYCGLSILGNCSPPRKQIAIQREFEKGKKRWTKGRMASSRAPSFQALQYFFSDLRAQTTLETATKNMCDGEYSASCL